MFVWCHLKQRLNSTSKYKVASFPSTTISPIVRILTILTNPPLGFWTTVARTQMAWKAFALTELFAEQMVGALAELAVWEQFAALVSISFISQFSVFTHYMNCLKPTYISLVVINVYFWNYKILSLLAARRLLWITPSGKTPPLSMEVLIAL